MSARHALGLADEVDPAQADVMENVIVERSERIEVSAIAQPAAQCREGPLEHDFFLCLCNAPSARVVALTYRHAANGSLGDSSGISVPREKDDSEI
jgi:hypothetical protein